MRCVFFFAIVASLVAQDTVHLTLAEAQRLAVENNPRISAARLSAAASYEVPKEIRSNLLPTLTGLATGVGADSASRLAAGGLNNPAVYSRLATGVVASQLLSDFGRTRGLIESSRLHAQAQDQVTEATRADILLAASRAFFNVLRAQATLEVAKQTVDARQLLADRVSALAENKLRSTLDVSFANVNLADAKLLFSQSQNDFKAAEAELGAVLGLPNQTTFDLRDEPSAEKPPTTVDPLVQQAVDNRPELKVLRLEQSSVERFAKAEHALNYPVIGAIGATGVVPAGEAAIASRYGAAGVNVTIPVFNGGLFKARQTEAELRAQSIAKNLNDLSNRVIRDVRVAYLNEQTAYERVGLTDQLLQQAKLSLDLAQSRYDLGLSSIVELSQAQLNVTSAQIANATARYEYQAQRVTVDYQTGTLR